MFCAILGAEIWICALFYTFPCLSLYLFFHVGLWVSCSRTWCYDQGTNWQWEPALWWLWVQDGFESIARWWNNHGGYEVTLSRPVQYIGTHPEQLLSKLAAGFTVFLSTFKCIFIRICLCIFTSDPLSKPPWPGGPADCVCWLRRKPSLPSHKRGKSCFLPFFGQEAFWSCVKVKLRFKKGSAYWLPLGGWQ